MKSWTIESNNISSHFTIVVRCHYWRSVFGVWRLLLDESEKIGKARLASADVFQSRISENAKNTRQAKLAVAKKCFDALRKYQDEVQQVRKNVVLSSGLMFVIWFYHVCYLALGLLLLFALTQEHALPFACGWGSLKRPSYARETNLSDFYAESKNTESINTRIYTDCTFCKLPFVA